MTATITAEQVRELRQRTGAAVLDCKQALAEAYGDMEKAITILRTKGKAQAAKKSQRATHEGAVSAYIHSNNKLGVLVSLQCETDFVAKSDRFQTLARDIALHVAAMDPLSVSASDIDAGMLAAERAIVEEQAAAAGKPAEIQLKMVEGKMKKFAEERALLSQPFVKDPGKTVADLISEAVSELGENITIGGFSRLAI
ncbi:MAG: translation elongation factor Ts [Candidatus Andersenbacteria bacterium CG10_big_fil_rev_8_21_14_0_10_54_11]|uniref:Elongation factor Ts n=1 Tax=Candidatus Andersenbacteria bacterium CG10_big_fil_rev_8_21_14_0_10_54_11 TaxID=1974485 RepID=A0A2M6WZX2_9BACT|nr:MAG: translation elongation factor Ts [Candidatus Andersenbacteria bacterium CG10_big_fil_rev_8_21_14_0_10_54_11]